MCGTNSVVNNILGGKTPKNVKGWKINLIHEKKESKAEEKREHEED
jgi:hypothetical protein